MIITVPGPPAPKPRQTQRDKWLVRPAVVRYRQWADFVRVEAYGAGRKQAEAARSSSYELRFYLPLPPSWSKKKRAAMAGTIHQAKPDIDNLVKATLDALLPDGDQAVAHLVATKRWEDAKGPRTEIVPGEGRP